MQAFHMLGLNMQSRNGTEKPWKVGETRTVKNPERIRICSYGYHSCAELGGLRGYLYGEMLCVVDVGEAVGFEDTKQVSAWRTLVAVRDVSRPLREFACDCATRALDRVEARGDKIDPRSRTAVEVARQYVRGDTSKGAMETARQGARMAADADADAAAAAAAADREAEIIWQRGHLAELLAPIVAEMLEGVQSAT